jgi:uncharacterized protein YuzE
LTDVAIEVRAWLHHRQNRHGQLLQAMKLAYHSDTDSLYIDFSEHLSVESREVSEGIVLDYDAAGSLVAIDIDNASREVQLQHLVFDRQAR